MDYTAILIKLYPNSQWTLNGENYDGLVWLSDTPKPTKAKLDSYWPDIETELANRKTAKIAARQAVLDKLGLTADEAAALLG